jgi:23S rRNA (guanine745-N1)-methyltransferase
MPRPGFELLRCPICQCDFAAVAGALVCPNRHSFDIARSGYINLLGGGRRRLPAAGGDSAAQLQHRAAFLDAGHLDAIGEMIAQHVRHATGANRRWGVIDAGCGTGHHLARSTALLTGSRVGLGLDISSAAGRHAARRWPSLAFATVDMWRPWPVQEGVADLVMSILAPKNFPEAARVLRPGGWLVVAYPGPEHLTELRDRFDLLRQHEAKSRRYAEALTRLIGTPSATRLYSRSLLSPAAVRDAVLMGPSARHAAAACEVAQPLLVTFDIRMLFARKSPIRR